MFMVFYTYNQVCLCIGSFYLELTKRQQSPTRPPKEKADPLLPLLLVVVIVVPVIFSTCVKSRVNEEDACQAATHRSISKVDSCLHAKTLLPPAAFFLVSQQ